MPPYMSQEQSAAAAWTAHMSPSGAPYYYNHVRPLSPHCSDGLGDCSMPTKAVGVALITKVCVEQIQLCSLFGGSCTKPET